MARLRESDIARQDAGASASATARIPAVQDGQLVTLTPNQIATGASAVDGPGSSTDNAFMRWNGTTGLLAQNSTSTLDDSGNAVFAGDITASGGDIDAGASGTAGSIDIFPSTSARGKIAITAADSTGDTITTITNASQAAARTYTIPDAGANASFVMTAGTQTLSGTTTITTLNTTNLDAGASGTAGSVDVFPSTAARGKITISAADSTGDTTTTITNASQAAARTYTIPDAGANASFVMTAGTQTLTGTTTIATLNTTNLDVGASGTAGTIDIFPTDASTGKLEFTKDPNTGDTTTTINVLEQAAARKYDVPDAGVDTNFVMDANVTGYQKFLGVGDLTHNTNDVNWSVARSAQGNIFYQKSSADETSILVFDVTEDIRTASSKGLQLTGFNYIFRNQTAALDAHTVTLDRVEYTDSAAISINSIGLTGSLGTGTDTDPQIDGITVTTPAFNNTSNSKYVLEVTVNAGLSSAYDFMGIVLTFTRNDFD